MLVDPGIIWHGCCRPCKKLVLLVILQKVQSEVVLFTAVFVLLTLLVNAPMLPVVLRMTKCAPSSPMHVDR